MDEQLLKQIEAMLEKGMSEEQIVAALGGGAPPPIASPNDVLAKATSIRPAPPRSQGLAKQALGWLMGIQDPVNQSTEEYLGTLPLPFTDQRIKPADALMTALGGVQAGMGAKGFMGGMRQGLMRPPMLPKPPVPSGVPLPKILPESPSIPSSFLKPEEGGLARAMLTLGQRSGGRFPNLVPAPAKPSVEDVISNVLRELYGK